MKIAYLLTTWPSRTETFVAREINLLTRKGLAITILAATAERGADSLPVPHAYAPHFVSLDSIRAFAYLITQYPQSILKYIILLSQLACVCPKEAIRLIMNLHTVAYFIRLLDRQNINHLHACFFNWPATIALAISYVSGRTFSIAAHARDLFVEPGALKQKVSSASFVILCSRFGLTFLQDRLPAHLHYKLRLCYHGLDANDLSVLAPNPTSQKSTTPLCLTVARMVPKKGLTVLLHAFHQIRQTYPAAQLIIIGDGPQRRLLQQLAARLELSSGVQFPGYLPNSQLPRFYHAASLLIVPSIQAPDTDCDGVPNVILEAFAARLPVVATTTGGITDAVIHQKTGLLVAPDNPNDLARSVIALLVDSALQKTLTDQARDFLSEKFSLGKNLTPLTNLFGECVQ